MGGPGVSIYSTLPGGSYGTLSGTSMATPFASRLAALMLDQNRNISVFQVKSAIMDTVLPDDSLTAKIVTEGYINEKGALTAVQGLAGDGITPAFTPDVPASSAPVLADIGKTIDIGPTGCGALSTGDSEEPFGGDDLLSLLSFFVMFIVIRLPGLVLTKR